MKNIITTLFLFSTLISFSQTENTDTTATELTKEADYVDPKKPSRTPEEKKDAMPFIKKLYFGGTFGASFGNYTTITVAPTIGYRLKPSLHTGLKFYYTYSKQLVTINRKEESYTYHSYGIGTFLRWFPFRDLYLHVAPEMMNYQQNTILNTGEVIETHEWVPFVWAGAGYRKMLGKNSWMTMHVLFDLVQDSNSPYRKWEPNYSVGIGTSF